jgi:hypothetical protein
MYNNDQIKSSLKPISRLLPKFLKQMQERFQERPDLILATWPQIIGEKHAAMTKAASFENGVLTVKVNNSTLYQLLVTYEKKRLLKSLKEKFCSVEIRDLLFRMG